MKRRFWSFLAGTGFALALVSTGAFAAALVDSVKGEARASMGPDRHGPLAKDVRLLTGTTITTGKDSQVVLRFDDGQKVVVNQNTEFTITDFKFDETKPEQDRSVFDLVKGALRVVTGKIGRRSKEAFALRTPQMTIGIRGTDFMVAMVNPTYVSVLQGSVAATNAAGSVVFGAGQIGMATASNAIAVAIPASSLPPAAGAAFSNMSTVAVSSAGAAAPGAAGAGAGGAAGLSAGTVGAIGAAAAGVAAAAGGGGGGGGSTTTHHTTTNH